MSARASITYPLLAQCSERVACCAPLHRRHRPRTGPSNGSIRGNCVTIGVKIAAIGISKISLRAPATNAQVDRADAPCGLWAPTYLGAGRADMRTAEGAVARQRCFHIG